MYTVQELQEDGREAAVLAAQGLCSTVAEPVAKRQPLLLHQQSEAIKRPVVRIGQQLHQGHHLDTVTAAGHCQASWKKLSAVEPEVLRVSQTCVVTSQPSSRLTMTDEPESRSSTTSTDTCSTLWSCVHTHTHTL